MSEGRIKVWDGLVRSFHWSLVIVVFVAYFTEPEDAGLALHVWAGYLVGGLIVLRIVWGFVGTPHARFSDFAFAPARALRYAFDLVRGRAERHIGHSPAGAWMVYLLLLVLGATVLTGMSVLAVDKHAGPLAPLFDSSPTAQAAQDHESGNRGEDVLEELHELLGNLVMILVALHILGVVVASVAHRENLARAMVTGWKRADSG